MGRRVLRILLLAGLAFALLGVAAWHWQSRLIGWAGTRYLERLASEDAGAGGIANRRDVVSTLHQQLLLDPPPDALVPALFDVATALTPRVARGEMTLAWAGHLYTNWAQDLLARRQDGLSPPDRASIRARIEDQIAFFAIRSRPDVPGMRLGDLTGMDDDVLTLEEIEAAHAAGPALDLGREPMRR